MVLFGSGLSPSLSAFIVVVFLSGLVFQAEGIGGEGMVLCRAEGKWKSLADLLLLKGSICIRCKLSAFCLGRKRTVVE